MLVQCGLVLVCVLAVVDTQGVLIPPVITEHPAEETIFKEGAKQISLKCSASGTPTPTVQWKKVSSSGAVLPMDSDRHIQQMTKLLINNPTEEDQGFYQCIATGTGVAMSNLGLVMLGFVEGSIDPVIPVDKIPVKKVKAGDSLRLECKAPPSYPKLVHNWQLAANDMTRRPLTVKMSERIALSSEGDLLFSYVTSQDTYNSGHPDGYHYMCSSYNPYIRDTEYSSPVRLQVEGVEPAQIAPRLLYSSNENTKAILGRKFSLKCVFAGKPSPKVYFFRDDPDLFPSTNRLMDNPEDFGTTLMVREAVESDGGRWSCGVVGNPNLRHDFYVTIESEPIWTRSPQNMNVSSGSSITYNCAADGTPQPTTEFYVNAEKITRSKQEYDLIRKDGIIKFYDVKKPGSLLVVQCKVTNNHGYSYKSGYLNVLDPMEIVYQPTSTYLISANDDNKQVEMKCHVTSDPSDPVVYVWYKEQRPLNTKLWGYSQRVEEGVSYLTINLNHGQKNVDEKNFIGMYSCLAKTLYNGWNVTVTGYKLQYTHGAGSLVDTEVSTAAASGPWYIAVIVGGIILVIIVILILCMVLRQGETYPVGKKERAAGHDPMKDDSGFHDYVRPSQPPTKVSQDSPPSSLNDSFYSDYKPAYDDGMDSVIGMDDIDPGKFNEDGSFIGAYGDDDEPQKSEQAQTAFQPYLFQQPSGDTSVFI